VTYKEEQQRRALLRDEEARRAADQYREKAKVLRAHNKLLNRWAVGIQVRDKRLRRTYTYLGNVSEDDGDRYLLLVTDPWGQTIKFSTPVSKEIVKVNHIPV